MSIGDIGALMIFLSIVAWAFGMVDPSIFSSKMKKQNKTRNKKSKRNQGKKRKKQARLNRKRLSKRLFIVICLGLLLIFIGDIDWSSNPQTGWFDRTTSTLQELTHQSYNAIKEQLHEKDQTERHLANDDPQRESPASSNESESKGEEKTNFNPPADDQLSQPDGEMTVHYIDVGQGDATFIKGTDFAILIDAGTHTEEDVVQYLVKENIERIDLVIGTHPHSDHIGQLDKVIQQFDVQEVWMSGEVHATHTYERAIDAILEHEVHYVEPRAGESYSIGAAHIQILNPAELTGDFNQSSISLKLTYGNISFLFTGDAEKEMEEWMLEQDFTLQSEVFQLGHHGSATSNTEAFLQAVQPQVALYSAGQKNKYGHPHREVIQRLEKMNIPYYGTDIYGTVLIKTDGEEYWIETESP